jgi:hypothetical protein
LRETKEFEAIKIINKKNLEEEYEDCFRKGLYQRCYLLF